MPHGHARPETRSLPDDRPRRGRVRRWSVALVLALVATLVPVTAAGAADPVDARYLGSADGLTLNHPIVGMASTPSGHGYWLVASDGGIFAYGDAAFYGSTGDIHLNKPIVGMASTPSGHGYWLVASDGGIFAYGDAPFLGSTGDIHLNKPIVGMASTPSGHGYWLVASDGGIFAYGDAPFLGSTGDIHLNKPIIGMASTPSGGGYWMAATDGGIFAFGDAPFLGSTGDIALARPIVGMAPSRTGGGYWLVASDGGAFNFGDAAFLGSAAGTHLDTPVIGMASGRNVTGFWMVTSDGWVLAFSPSAPPLGVDAYRGLGTWVDRYDFAREKTDNPSVTPADVATMAAAGVRTIYIQAAGYDTEADLVSPDILGAFLREAHARGMLVVGWYLPTLTDVDADLRHLIAISDFEMGGERFDGVGVDIEARDVADPDLRSDRLVELSTRLRRAVGVDALSAIVLPPVVTDVINLNYWPRFPWHELSGLYDVWMPMGYWTTRNPTTQPQWRDAHNYTVENVNRVRANLGDPYAVVHPVGGIGDLQVPGGALTPSTAADYQGFVQAATETASIGRSIYDWATTGPSAWPILRG